MHELVRFVNLRSVRLTGKSGETLLEDINPQRLITGDEHIDTQIELVAIDQ